jgi:hypothetical protein
VTTGGQQIPSCATYVSWRDPQNNGLPQSYGVYIVENFGEPVYAGEAAYRTILERYDGKRRGVHELGFSCQLSQTLRNQRVWAGIVAAQGRRLDKAIDLLEAWLIRYLLIRDFNLVRQRRPPVRKILNIKKTNEEHAPAGGMTLSFNIPAGLGGLGYLWDPTLQDLDNPRHNVAVAGGNANNFSYVYAASAPF